VSRAPRGDPALEADDDSTALDRRCLAYPDETDLGRLPAFLSRHARFELAPRPVALELAVYAPAREDCPTTDDADVPPLVHGVSEAVDLADGGRLDVFLSCEGFQADCLDECASAQDACAETRDAEIALCAEERDACENGCARGDPECMEACTTAETQCLDATNCEQRYAECTEGCPDGPTLEDDAGPDG
jgi:hypothetical protein